jgi:hypothetical protein
MTNIMDGLKAIVYPPGWRPGVPIKWFVWPWGRMADTEDGIPEVFVVVLFF